MRLERRYVWKYCFRHNDKWFGYCYDYEWDKITINMYVNGSYEHWYGQKIFWI